MLRWRHTIVILFKNMMTASCTLNISSKSCHIATKDCRSWTQKARARKKEFVLLNMTRRKKRRAKTILQKDNMPAGQGKVHPEKKTVTRVLNNKRGNCSHDRECDFWHLPHCKYHTKENREHVGQSTMLMKGILALRRNLPSEREKHQILA